MLDPTNDDDLGSDDTLAQELQPQLEKLNPQPDIEIKLVVAGDGGIGKTSLLVMYCSSRFPRKYTPTVFENYIVNKTYKNKIVGM